MGSSSSVVVVAVVVVVVPGYWQSHLLGWPISMQIVSTILFRTTPEEAGGPESALLAGCPTAWGTLIVTWARGREALVTGLLGVFWS